MPNASLHHIDGRIFRVFIREDGILQVDIHDDSYFELADAKELVEAAAKLGEGKRFLNLINVGKGTLVDDKARNFSSSIEGSIYKLADAFVINSFAQQLIANFIIKVNRPPVPTAFFKSADEAVQWLKSLDLTKS
jgi:hypothetical protein